MELFEHISDVEFRDAYFGASQERGQFTSGSESHQERGRKVEKPEMIHLMYIAAVEWHRFWDRSLGNFLKESTMNAMLFYYFALQVGRTITVQTYALICLPW
jgi:hypothetical protein